MLNRAAGILTAKQSSVDWSNEADPFPDSKPTTLEQVNDLKLLTAIEQLFAKLKTPFSIDGK